MNNGREPKYIVTHKRKDLKNARIGTGGMIRYPDGYQGETTYRMLCGKEDLKRTTEIQPDGLQATVCSCHFFVDGYQAENDGVLRSGLNDWKRGTFKVARAKHAQEILDAREALNKAHRRWREAVNEAHRRGIIVDEANAHELLTDSNLRLQEFTDGKYTIIHDEVKI